MCVCAFFLLLISNMETGSIARFQDAITARICCRAFDSSDPEKNMKTCRRLSILLHTHAVATAKTVQWLSEAE